MRQQKKKIEKENCKPKGNKIEDQNNISTEVMHIQNRKNETCMP